MVNTPLPCNLKSEAKKAAKILKEFTVPTAKMGPDKLIPAGILMKAKGLAVLTVIKAGFLVTARGGSGIVIAKLNDGFTSEWSAPSAIGIAGLGGGFEIGAEVTDFVIILNKRSAVEAFSKGGNLTLGGNFTIAAGPLGRNLEADVAVRSAAAIYTYSKTRGLFAGISVEGSALIERKDANKKFYGRDIRTVQILRGDVDPPPECDCLYEVLESHKKAAERELVRMAKRKALKETESLRSGLKIPGFGGSSKKKSRERSGSTASRERSGSSASRDWDSDSSDDSPAVSRRVTKETSRSSVTKTTSSSSVRSSSASSLSKGPFSQDRKSPSSYRHSEYKPSRPTRPRSSSGASTGSSDDAWDVTAKAIYPFAGQIPCDLTFKTGDEISVLRRTDSQNDWWEGRLKGGRVGIFPANYVRLQ